MSHIVEIKTEVRDPSAILAACRRLQLPVPQFGNHRMFDGSSPQGYGVKLPGWSFPVVCQPETGALKYDNFNGHWGKTAELDRFMQAYAIEKAKIEARKKGKTCTETTLKDGSVKLTIQA